MAAPRLFQQEPEVNHLRRVRIELCKSYPELKSLLFLGVAGGEGVSTLAASFALECAREGGEKVALVDAHAVPGLDTLLTRAGIPKGLDTINRAELEGAAGDGVPLPERLGLGLGRIIKGHDLTICDAPPLGRDALSAELAGLVDGVLVVVEANITLADQLALVRERLERANARIVGSLINRQGRFMPSLGWR